MKLRIVLVLSALITFAPTLSLAKITDFDSLLADSEKELKEVRAEAQKTAPRRPAARTRGVVVVNLGQTQVNMVADEKVLKYGKEKSTKSVSHDEQMNRVTKEFQDSNAD